MSETYLPGQPLSIPQGATPLLGAGTYTRYGKARASLVGVPSMNGGVGPLVPPSTRPNNPTFLW